MMCSRYRNFKDVPNVTWEALGKQGSMHLGKVHPTLV